MMLSQKTLKLMDDLEDGETIEIYYTRDGRERMAIGAFAGFRKFDGEWCILRRGTAAIPMIEVDSVERVEVNKAR